MNTAFDYDSQQWVNGEIARELRIEQLTQELSLLRGPAGERYAHFCGIRDMAETMARMENELSTLKH